MAQFPAEPEPVAKTCSNCRNTFYTVYLDQRYCGKHCKDSAAQKRQRARSYMMRSGQAPLAPQSTRSDVQAVQAEITSERMKAVVAAQDAAAARGASKEEIVKAGQDVLDNFRPVQTDMEKAIHEFFGGGKASPAPTRDAGDGNE